MGCARSRRVPFRGLFILFLAIGLSWGGHVRFLSGSTTLEAALQSITGEELHDAIAFLASDELEGREAGTAGGKKAQKFLVEQLQTIGLPGAGDDSYLQPFAGKYANVLACLPGRDECLANEYVIVCAHYDHVGRLRKPRGKFKEGEICNGADDNASGCAAVLEIAEAFTMLGTPPKRTVVFAFWDAEEKGLVGSRYWCSHPTLPLERVKAVINLDMLGRFRQNGLTIYGTRTAIGWRKFIALQNSYNAIAIDFPIPVLSLSDHWPFVQAGVPGLLFHTGLHEDYHTPSDDTEKIDFDGMLPISQLAFRIAYAIAEDNFVPQYREAWQEELKAYRAKQQQRQKQRQRLRELGEEFFNPFLAMAQDRIGITWRITRQEEAMRVVVDSVRMETPADRAGLEPGDIIEAVDGRRVETLADLVWPIVSAKKQVRLSLLTFGEQAKEVTLTLLGEPVCWGLTLKEDAAEPGTVVVSAVAPGSPAQYSGLCAEDRIYEIDGRQPKGVADVIEILKDVGPHHLTIERSGILQEIELRHDAKPPTAQQKTAAVAI